MIVCTFARMSCKTSAMDLLLSPVMFDPPIESKLLVLAERTSDQETNSGSNQ